MRYSICVAVLSLLALSGCVAYVGDRLKDASEIIEVSVGLSVGLDVNARATKVFQIGLGSYSGDWMGLKEGRLALWREERSELGIAPLYFHEVFRTGDTLLEMRHPLILDPGYGPYMNDLGLMTDRGFFEVGATANAVVVGIDIGVEGAEILDFLSGFIGMDILWDDAYSESLEDLVCRTQSADPYKRAAAARALRRRTGANHGYIIFTDPDEHPDDQIQAWREWKKWLDEN